MSRIGIVGVGAVGCACAMAAINRGSAREIAARFELSRAFVANILKLLCGKGFVTSHRGVKGGYVLERPADEVTLAELMDALDDSFESGGRVPSRR